MGGGHKISDESIALSYKHAEQVAQEGKRLEELGVLLSRSKQLTQHEREFVQEAIQQIQSCARAMFQYTRVAESNTELSTNAFGEAVKSHTEAIRLHVEINKILLKLDLVNSEIYSNRQS